jgi:hypothetical protein
MRCVWFLLLLGCEHGQSVAPDNCTHTQLDSQCCLDDRGCTSENARFCVPPGVVQDTCGECDPTPSACTSDFDCQAMDPTSICEEIPCACVGNRACVPGCVENIDCGEGEICDNFVHRCMPKQCATDDACPIDFFCAGSRCFRRGCTTSTECDGFCVEGLCHPVAGECQAPAS